ncbi:MAG TPA: plastocyanin/azurin family copper-binding protein, partial [Baekduia sp.]|nr:plastocyanin/azurin family copper-binding protein [Baekduia sp.]
MSRRSPAIALLALAAGLGPASAAWADQGVAAQFDAFAPSQLDVLPGEAVTWTNVSTRTHTVNADAGEFASGDLVAAATFSVRFDAPGAHPYHCMLHPGMVGEVDVRPVILDALPPAAVPAGQHVTLSGRTADPGEAVRVERSTGGGPFDAVATAAPSGDGRWRVAVPATATADYRAVSAAGTSETRRLLVSDRRVAIAATRAGVRVRVTPSVPYGRIVLERRER